jgi:hypothetical protein
VGIPPVVIGGQRPLEHTLSVLPAIRNVIGDKNTDRKRRWRRRIAFVLCGTRVPVLLRAVASAPVRATRCHRFARVSHSGATA